MTINKEIQDKKDNAKLYPIYKMLSWDLLFYYSIIYLFLVQAKSFTPSQVLLGEAFFTISCLVLQIPLGVTVDKFGKKRSLIFANICMCIFTLLLLNVQTYYQLLFAFLIEAIGYVIKGICETNILYDSLPQGKKRGGLYSQIDGIGTSRYYIIDAITSVIAGFTFIINPYIPIILSAITNFLAVIISTKFKHTNPSKEDEETIRQGLKKYFKDLKEIAGFSIKSKRMFSLLLFFGIISGLLYSMTTFRSGVLNYIELPEQYFGIVLALSQIVAAICSRTQNILHKKLRNKTLSVLGICLTFSCIIIGCLATLKSSIIIIMIIVLLFVVQGATKGAYYVLIYRYLNNFTNRKVRIKLATIRNMFYNLFATLITIFGAALLNITSAANAMIVIGCASSIAIVILLDYMRDKVGLKIYSYKTIDLKYSSINKQDKPK